MVQDIKELLISDKMNLKELLSVRMLLQALIDSKGKQNMNTKKCGLPCEIYARVTGYITPVSKWNTGKKEEFKQRSDYKVETKVNKANQP